MLGLWGARWEGGGVKLGSDKQSFLLGFIFRVGLMLEDRTVIQVGFIIGVGPSFRERWYTIYQYLLIPAFFYCLFLQEN